MTWSPKSKLPPDGNSREGTFLPTATLDTLAEASPVANNFCILPWTHLTVSSVGNVSLCCNNMEIEHADTGELWENLYGRVSSEIKELFAGNVKTDDVEDMWNGSYYKDARKSMLAGKKHWACSKCWREEEGGMVSDRMQANKLMSMSNIEYLVNNTNEDGFFDMPPRELRFVLGNVCNLQCQMCGPSNSSSWASLWTRVSKKEGFKVPKEWSDPTTYDWARKPIVWTKQFQPLMKYCQFMYLLGGEPFLAPEHYDLLQYCVDNNYSKNIVLRYNTNCTIPISSKTLRLWEHFKFVDMQLSIDAVEEQNDYIRYPSKWETIMKFTDFIDKETPENIGGGIFSTVSITNVYYLPELMDWVDSQNFKKITPINYLNMVHMDEKQNIQALPLNAKKIVDQRLTSWYDTHNKPKYSRVTQVIEFMYREDLSKLYPEFIRNHGDLDRIRGTNFYEAFPIFKEFDK